MFTGWLVGIDKKLKSQIFVGASVICWAIWLTRNNIVFDKVAAPSYLQLSSGGTYWTRFWSLLQNEEDGHLVKMGCRTIETVAIEVFARHGWSFTNRLAF
jgi:hypothetical protein